MTLDASGRIAAWKDYGDRTVAFAYSAAGDLTCITDALGNVTRLTNSAHALTKVSRGAGATCAADGDTNWAIGYGAGQVTVTSPEAGGNADTVAFGPDSASWTQYVGLDDAGATQFQATTFALDSLGRAVSVTDPTTAVTLHAFDDNGNETSTTVPAADTDPGTGDLVASVAVTTRTFDAGGHLSSETAPLAPGPSPAPADTVVTAYTYWPSGDVQTKTEADNDDAIRVVTYFEYDAAGHVLKEVRDCTSSGTSVPAQGQGGTCTGTGTHDASTNVTTDYAYNANGQLEYERDPLGRVTRHVYANGQETSVIANCVAQPAVAWPGCPGGNLADPAANVTTSSAFDTSFAGRLSLPSSTSDAMGASTSFTYFADGSTKTESSTPVGGGTKVVTSAYDAFGNLTSETTAAPGVATAKGWAFDKENRETRAAAPAAGSAAAVTTVSTYNSLDEVTSTHLEATVSGPPSMVRAMTYSTASNATTDANGKILSITTFVDNTAVVNSDSTDGATDVVRVERPDGSVLATRTYPRNAAPGTPVKLETRTFDRLGRETSVKIGLDPLHPLQTTASTYDRLGRLVSSNANGVVTAYTYDAAGNRVSSTDGAGVVTTTTYDALNRATVVTVNDVATPTLPTEDVTTTTYYDASGNVIATRDPRGITTRSIYTAGRLTRTIANCTDTGTTPTADPPHCTGGGTLDFTTNVRTDISYDAEGRAVSREVLGGPPAPPLLAVYDAKTLTAYDADGQVRATMDAMGTVTRNLYDEFGRLIDTYVNCTSSVTGAWYDCDGLGTASRTDGTANLVRNAAILMTLTAGRPRPRPRTAASPPTPTTTSAAGPPPSATPRSRGERHQHHGVRRRRPRRRHDAADPGRRQRRSPPARSTTRTTPSRR
ncbi:MAG: hypothetical protein U0838_05695 [Chloroflexota bacterium]